MKPFCNCKGGFRAKGIGPGKGIWGGGNFFYQDRDVELEATTLPLLTCMGIDDVGMTISDIHEMITEGYRGTFNKTRDALET